MTYKPLLTFGALWFAAAGGYIAADGHKLTIVFFGIALFLWANGASK